MSSVAPVLVWLVVSILLIAYPAARILNRLGLSKYWAVLGIIPFFNVLGLWLLAFADWPSRPSEDSPEGQKEWSEADWKAFRELERQRRQ